MNEKILYRYSNAGTSRYEHTIPLIFFLTPVIDMVTVCVFLPTGPFVYDYYIIRSGIIAYETNLSYETSQWSVRRPGTVRPEPAGREGLPV